MTSGLNFLVVDHVSWDEMNLMRCQKKFEMILANWPGKEKKQDLMVWKLLKRTDFYSHSFFKKNSIIFRSMENPKSTVHWKK